MRCPTCNEDGLDKESAKKASVSNPVVCKRCGTGFSRTSFTAAIVMLAALICFYLLSLLEHYVDWLSFPVVIAVFFVLMRLSRFIFRIDHELTPVKNPFDTSS